MCEDFEVPVVEMTDEELSTTLQIMREEIHDTEAKLNARIEELAKLVMAIDTHQPAKPHNIPDQTTQNKIRAWGPIYSEAIVTQEGNIYRVSNVRLTLEQIEQFTAQRKPISAPPPPAPC